MKLIVSLIFIGTLFQSAFADDRVPTTGYVKDGLSAKQDSIMALGDENLLTAPTTIGGQPGTKAISDFATAAQGAKADTAVQTVSVATGTNNGTVKVTVNGSTVDNIAVKGLGSAAYTNSNMYAPALVEQADAASAQAYSAANPGVLVYVAAE